MTGFCKWCYTLTDDIVQDFDDAGMLIWTGCLSCKQKRVVFPRGKKNILGQFVSDFFSRMSKGSKE